MSDLDGMSQEELWAWAERERERSRSRFAGQPVPRISRAKRDDYPHLEFNGWVFRLWDGAPARVRLGRGHEDCVDGVVRGLREVSNGGPLALLVELGDRGLWALRRDDGEVWAAHVGARDGTASELEVPVEAWSVPPTVLAPAAVVAAARSRESWTVRTNRLEES